MSSSSAETAAAHGPRAVVREECPHLSDSQWAALQRMAESIGEAAVGAMLLSLSHNDQHASIATFMERELEESRRDAATLRERGAQQLAEAQRRIETLQEQAVHHAQLLHHQQQQAVDRPRRVETLKVDVSKYKAAEGDSLLRWLVELDDAIVARRIDDESMRVTFAMSNLAGRAKAWALGLKLRDPHCFPSFEVFRQKLKQAFEPPKSEFRARTEFLELKQGKSDIHSYAQRARYLVSCVVEDPIDDTTQVVTYVKGLVDGPIKTHLFRKYPETLERAIDLSLEEDFSLRQAYVHSSSYRPTKRDESGGAEPMDLSVAVGASRQSSDKSKKSCNRCKKLGHFAYECLAPRPASQSGNNGKARWPRSANKQSERQPKNGKGQ